MSFLHGGYGRWFWFSLSRRQFAAMTGCSSTAIM